MGFQLSSLTAWPLKKARHRFGVAQTLEYLPDLEAVRSDRSPRRRVRIRPAYLEVPCLTRRINARRGWRTSGRELVPGSNWNDRSFDTTAIRA